MASGFALPGSDSLSKFIYCSREVCLWAKPTGLQQ
jgi:hypothetical protein